MPERAFPRSGSLLTRRALLAGSLASLVTPAAAADGGVLVGAIRWDAWYERRGLAIPAQDSLEPAAFRYRAPLQCTTRAGTFSCVGDQAGMDAEIAAAARAGLAFWAFDWYAADSPFRRAWDLYQSSKINHLVAWCATISLGDIGSPAFSLAEMDAKAAAWASLMTQPTYCRTTIDGERRPLLILFYREAEMKTYFGSLPAMRAGFDRLRVAAARAGAGNPYVVILDPPLDTTLFTASGTDALSNYIAGFRSVPAGTYAALDVQVRAYWNAMLATGEPMVPIVQVGWDVRPVIAHPMPSDAAPAATGEPPHYYAMATPDAFAAEVTAAITFVVEHPDACRSRVVLAYSWDECAEGGCIMPTIGDPRGSYLAALGRVLQVTDGAQLP